MGFGAAIGGIANLGAAGLNTYATGNQNRKSREWSDRQWHRNYRSTWDMWRETNKYNLPKNQMARFKEAGLNPNLIYGV